MKSGIKKIARERKEKKLIITQLEATGPMPLIKRKKKFMPLTFHSPIV